ncbi:hypothetical protein CIB95_09065 [Lottiidibacillus patelloidae]|uniref:Uncharacterized protein n=1 Tax=Lottiidibacillus patelloidae TaxID=2670334 RepID=A0A263BT61_9BACI|nr:hypothetical protein [Lottiidibacillus patelloidae]OZM56910.1 hypothetical protein CIB95_09065 [Lottiidibacillus patelloidae]
MSNGLFLSLNILLLLFHFFGVFLVIMANALSASMELGLGWYLTVGFIAASPHLVLMVLSYSISKSKDKDATPHIRTGGIFFAIVFLVYVIAQAFVGGL